MFFLMSGYIQIINSHYLNSYGSIQTSFLHIYIRAIMKKTPINVHHFDDETTCVPGTS